jgi:hypothetical protein
MKLAAALLASGGNGGDCLAQVSSGPETLRNPEPGLFVLGMKSYGRGSAFLLRLGYEQVGQPQSSRCPPPPLSRPALCAQLRVFVPVLRHMAPLSGYVGVTD